MLKKLLLLGFLALTVGSIFSSASPTPTPCMPIPCCNPCNGN